MATSRTTFRNGSLIRRAAGSGAALIFAAAGLLVTAGVATAHNPAAMLTCGDGTALLTVTITNYSPGVKNTVAASIDGSSVLPVTTFGSSYSTQIGAGDPTVGHTAAVVITAGDDPTGSKGWTTTFNLSIQACEPATPTATPTAAPTATPTAAPTATPTAAPTATPAATPTDGDQGSALPTGGVEGATGAPQATPPTTSTLGSDTPGPSSASLGFLLMLFAGVLLSIRFARELTRR